MKYRSEIDGLRAVAILPVILFHAGIGIFSGGFVGVDVFFVISGYLITLILLNEIEDGSFSIARFYERRARRILPALFVVLAFSIVLAFVWMTPAQMAAFGDSVVATLFFVSNFLFWREEGGYFAANAELKPLLHTWSLAVEEQYYLFAPLCLALLWRFGRRTVFWCVVLTALASLLATEWGWRYAPRANFYLPQFRIWELLAGSICGFLATARPPKPNDALAAAGLALILIGIFAFDGGTPFPSLYALAPVGGTALVVLYAQRGTWVARLLSLRPFVGIGLISYSAYLWHQPLFAFARIRSLAAPPEWLLLVLSLVSLILAYLTWRFIEQPFRRRPLPLLASRRAVFAASLAVGLAFAGFGIYSAASGGIPGRVTPPAPGSREARLLQSVQRHALPMNCTPAAQPPRHKDARADLCAVFTPDNPKLRILVIGDSHAGSILPAFAGIGRDNAVYYLGVASCPPINRVSILHGVFDRGVCEEATRREMEAVRDGHFDAVVLVARWSLYAGWNGTGKVRYFALAPEESADFPSLALSRETFASRVPATVADYLKLGVGVVLLNQIPEQAVAPQTMLEQAIFLGLDGWLGGDQFERAIWRSSVTVAADRDRQAFTKAVLDRLQGRDVWVLSVDEAFEKDGRYVWGDRNGSYYMDDNHLSANGAAFLAPAMTQAFAPVERSLLERRAQAPAAAEPGAPEQAGPRPPPTSEGTARP